jgi:hypothetical protein
VRGEGGDGGDFWIGWLELLVDGLERVGIGVAHDPAAAFDGDSHGKAEALADPSNSHVGARRRGSLFVLFPGFFQS